MDYYLGIDLGGTHISAGVVNEDYSIISKRTVPIDEQKRFDAIMDQMASVASEAVGAAGLRFEDILESGICSPGIVDSINGTVVLASNLRWESAPLVREFEKRTGLRANLSNDANCAALGEVLAGSARGLDNAVMLTLGTGVGGGIVIDKKIYGGTDSMGAELGHIMLVLGGEECSCGRLGCFEAYASATALIRQTRRAAEENRDSLLNELCGNDHEKITGKTAFEAMKQKDGTAIRVLEQYAFYIAEGITDLINIFRPEIVIIGGGISGAGESLLELIRKHVGKYMFASDLLPVPRIVAAELGNDAGIIGAAALRMHPCPPERFDDT